MEVQLRSMWANENGCKWAPKNWAGTKNFNLCPWKSGLGKKETALSLLATPPTISLDQTRIKSPLVKPTLHSHSSARNEDDDVAGHTHFNERSRNIYEIEQAKQASIPLGRILEGKSLNHNYMDLLQGIPPFEKDDIYGPCFVLAAFADLHYSPGEHHFKLKTLLSRCTVRDLSFRR